MQWKYEREILPANRCCFCCHVRTGTLILGLVHLLSQTLALSAVGVLVYRPELMESFLFRDDDVNTSVSPAVENPLLSHTESWNTDSLSMGAVMIIGLMAVTLSLIYGTVRAQPKYMTPFFCVQIFEMCVISMVMLSYFSSTQELRLWIKDQHYLPKKELLLDIDDNNLMALTLIIFVFILFFKMYFIGVVWACYKYLQQYAPRPASETSSRRYNLEMLQNSEDSEMLLPPKYEDVIRMPATPPASEPAPPAYTED